MLDAASRLLFSVLMTQDTRAFSGLVKTEATSVGWIFLKKIHFRGCREVHTIPENALYRLHSNRVLGKVGYVQPIFDRISCVRP